MSKTKYDPNFIDKVSNGDYVLTETIIKKSVTFNYYLKKEKLCQKQI